MAFDAGSIESRLTLDRSPFQQGLELAKAEGRDFAAQRWTSTAGVNVDDERFRALDAELDAFGHKRETATASVNVDNASARRALAQLDDDANNVRRDVRGIGSDAAGAENGLSGMLTAALSLGPALVPIGAVGVGALAAFIPLLATAGTGLLGVAAVAMPALSGISANLQTIEQAQQAYNNATTAAAKSSALKTLQADYAKLTPVQATFVQQFLSFKDAWGAWAAQFQPQLFALLSTALGTALRFLQGLTPVIGPTLGALNTILGQIGTAIQGPAFQRFIAFVASEAPQALTILAGIFGNVLKLVAGLAEAFAPLMDQFAGGLERLIGSWATMAQNLGASAGFQSFLAYVRDNAPLVGQLLSDLGGFLVALATAAAPVGPVILQILNALVPLLTALLRVPDLGTIIVVLTGLVAVAVKLAGPIGAIVRLLPMVATGIGLVADAFAFLAANPVVLIIAAIVAAIALLGVGIYELVTHWSTVWNAIKSVATDVWHFLYSDVIGPLINFFTKTLPGVFDSAVGFLRKWGPKIIEALVAPWALLLPVIINHWGEIAAFFESIPGKILDLLKALPGDLEQAAEYVIAGFIAGLAYAALGVWDFFTKLVPKVVGYFVDALTWLYQAGVNVLTGLLNGLVDFFTGPFVSFWTALPGEVVGFFSAAVSWLVTAGSDILTGLYNGLVAFFTGPFVAFWTALPGVVVGFFAAAASWLVQAGSDVINGLWSGIQAIWNAVVSFFEGIPGAVESFFSDAITWLYDAGKAVLTGFVHGLEAAWNDAAGFLGGILDKVKSLKGPLDKDRVALIPHGRALMEGLHQGLVEGYEALVVPTVAAMAGGIATALSASTTVSAGSLTTTGLGPGATPIYAPVTMHGVDLSNPDATEAAVTRAVVHLARELGSKVVSPHG